LPGNTQIAETGLIYMRARYYDPQTRQFLTRDPLVALTRQPYLYANGNPVNFTDPSGLDDFEGSSGGGRISNSHAAGLSKIPANGRAISCV
jgi:RHS repeat-associated protein